jgi:hypothetical protein
MADTLAYPPSDLALSRRLETAEGRGSASQRNAERHGFRIAYTRIKWSL